MKSVIFSNCGKFWKLTFVENEQTRKTLQLILPNISLQSTVTHFPLLSNYLY